MLDKWPGPRHVAMNTTPVLDSIRYELNTDNLFTFGSVIHPAIDLVVKMGATNIVLLTLFDADFGYANNKTHAVWKDGALGPKFKHRQEWITNGFSENIRAQHALPVLVEQLILNFPLRELGQEKHDWLGIKNYLEYELQDLLLCYLSSPTDSVCELMM